MTAGWLSAELGLILASDIELWHIRGESSIDSILLGWKVLLNLIYFVFIFLFLSLGEIYLCRVGRLPVQSPN